MFLSGNNNAPMLVCRLSLLHHARDRFDTDGLNSLEYELLDIEKRPLYTRLYVRIHE